MAPAQPARRMNTFVLAWPFILVVLLIALFTAGCASTDKQGDSPLTESPAETAETANTKVVAGSLQVSVVDTATIQASDDPSDRTPLPGATYALTDDAGTTVATFTTDADGEFEIDLSDPDLADLLPADGSSASYTLAETAAPQGYELSTLQLPITIECSVTEDEQSGTAVREYAFYIDGNPGGAVTVGNSALA